MTSGLSTFPYEADEIRKILTLLVLVQSKAHERHTVVIAARFWSVISEPLAVVAVLMLTANL